MIKLIFKDKCCGCYGCYNVCPKSCIKMVQDSEGFYYPNINQTICVNCGLCEQVCPVLNPRISTYKPRAYAAINKDEIIRKGSSSGGIFSLIAEYVLKQGGGVFGAAFDKNFDVCHQSTTIAEDLAMFRGSKYVQSKIGSNYQRVKEILEDGILVLFTGTPCQVNGLNSFLRREYTNLICMDFICHGVPSPLVWRKYIEYRCTVDAGILRRVSFRLKDKGWKLFAVLFEYLNKTAYRKKLFEDIYMKGFLSNLYLRPSCYNCSFKTEHRISDFTLADFWGIEKILPEMDDDKGVSLVIVQSEKGSNIFETISNNMIYKSVKLSDAICYNTSMVTSVKCNKNRKQFFRKLAEGESIEILIDKYTRANIFIRTLHFVKKTIKTLIT